jgi:hypothetical protein
MGIGYQKEIDNNAQSQTNPLFQYYLMQEQKTDITLTAPVSTNDTVINVSAGHGFTGAAGEYLVIRIGDAFEQTAVVSVVTNAIEVEMPMPRDFPISSGIIRGNIGMNVDGSLTPVEFKYSSNCCGDVNATTPVDISTVIITMQHGANVPDDGKFGGLAALTNGMYFRKENGEFVNLGNYKNNQKFKDLGAVVEYTSKAPAGTNATNILFGLEEMFGQVVRIDPRTPDLISAIIRDDIGATAGMVNFTMSLVGSYTAGE